MKYEYHIIVLGAGSAGLSVASGAAALGARVALVEADLMGGECLNTGCVPSKSFLRCAHLAAEIRAAGGCGISTALIGVDVSRVMSRVRDVIRAIAPHDSAERFASLGVDVFRGRGLLADDHAVRVNDTVLTGNYIVLATGSAPAIPPIPGLSDAPFYTNETIFTLDTLPEKLLVLGGGPLGLELGQGFRHLGAEVEIIDASPRLFAKEDQEVAPLMERVFGDEGIVLTLGADITGVTQSGAGIRVAINNGGAPREVVGSHLLVSLGRSPATADMGLERVGVTLDREGFVAVSPHLRTSVKSVYACGDVAGPYRFTHMAAYQAGIVLRNIIFPLLKSKVDYSAVPWTTYTRPEVAHAGYTEPGARSDGVFSDAVVIDLKENDRAQAENDVAGFLKLVTGGRGRIIGATMVGGRAGDIIPLAAMAIRNGMRVKDFMSIIFPYPTEAELFKQAGVAAAKQSLRPWMRSVIKALLVR